MKNVKFLKILYFLSVIIIASCGGGEIKEIQVDSVTLSAHTISLKVNEERDLTATVSPANAVYDGIRWSSDDNHIATVKDGKVMAVSVGSTQIKATAGSKSASCFVQVVPVDIESVTLDKTEVVLKPGQSATIKATVNPSDATDKTVIWTTSDDSIATVKDGVVTAVEIGTATIIASAGSKLATCKIVVEARPVVSVTLDKTSATLKAGQIIQLTATVKPDDASDKTVIWSSSDSGVATVEEGKVTAIKTGSATITAKAGDQIASCIITVEATPVTSVTLDRSTATLKAGQTITLTATVKPDDATDKTVVWSSSDTDIATVENGVVTAVKVGTATITASSGDKFATCTITVEAIPVTSIALNRTSITLKAGESFTLTATVGPSDATDRTVTWTSSDKTVATVSDGVVSAIRVGTSTITARAGDKTATCIVTVEATPVLSISLNKTESTLRVGGTVVLTATIYPEDATDKTVTWSTSDSNVASVKDGLVTALKLGSATITAKSGSASAICSIKVEATPVESVSLNMTSLELTTGDEYNLKVTVNPSDASDKSVSWRSSNANVATVDSDGTVRAISEGNATITVTTNSGSKTANCEVNVKAKLYPVTGVSLNKTSLSMTKNDTEVLVATITPSNATNMLVNWSSDNESVATVDSEGMVKAVGGGTATITVTTADGGKTATCSVSVYSPVISVSLDRTSAELKVGDKLTLKAVINPGDASDKAVTWSSSKPTVASVDENGKVTAIAIGTATIKVTTKDGGKTAICNVVVKNQLEDYDDYELF